MNKAMRPPLPFSKDQNDLAPKRQDAPMSGGTAGHNIAWQCAPLNEVSGSAFGRDFAAEWQDLNAQPSEANLFQSPAFLMPSLPLLASQNPVIVTIREGDLLIGALILRRDVGYAKLPVTFWRSALHHEQYLGTPLVRAGHEGAFAAGLCAWLDQAPRQYCFVILSLISPDGAIAKAIAQHCAADGRLVSPFAEQTRAAIAPSGRGEINADQLLSSNRRKGLRKARKNLAKHVGGEEKITIQTLAEAADLAAWIEDFLRLENSGWKKEQGSSILSCKHETALYKAIISDAFAAGNLHFSRLCADGQAIAYTLDIAAPPMGFCLKSAIDQDYRKFSPGVLMEYATLAHYLGKSDLALVDSCSAPDNHLLNELWPDRKTIADLAIARKGAFYSMIFRIVRRIKGLTGSAAGA